MLLIKRQLFLIRSIAPTPNFKGGEATLLFKNWKYFTTNGVGATLLFPKKKYVFEPLNLLARGFRGSNTKFLLEKRSVEMPPSLSLKCFQNLKLWLKIDKNQVTKVTKVNPY